MTTWSTSSGEISSSYTHSPNEVIATWSQSNGEIAASWYSIESEEYGFIFWEGFDDLNWEDMVVQASEYGGQSKWEDLG
ncbi:hypothetical protein HN682_07500 [Candidatus Peregrinibacteria bacterium]|jgi:hypothetical protein|nr:hypothetical protein [Candidatus Peregrinibacteria bacterium]